MKILKPISMLALAAAAALTLSSCSAGDSSSTGDRLKVVTTTTQLTDFTQRIGGDDIELTGLLAAGGSAHHFDPTPADLLALGRADVLIVNGAGLDEFIDSAIEASGFEGAIIDASEGIDLEEARAITLEAGDEAAGHDHDHGEAHEDEDHAAHDHAETAEGAEAHTHTEEDDHADHDHSDEAHAEHDHDHGDLNPHIWTSPRLAQGIVDEIGHGLAEADSAHANDYEQRAHELIDQLGALDEWAAAQFERLPEEQRVLVTGHDSLRYYLHDYDITFAGSLLPSFEDNAEPSAAEIDALVEAIKASGVKAIFVESSLSPKLAQTVANEAGVAVVDAESLYADSLGPEGSGAETYIDATVHNTRVILEAWGVTPDPLPSELGAQ